MNPAPNLVFVGPMGAGKTSIGRRVAASLGLEFCDTDELLESRTGAAVALIFDLEGESGFRSREQALLGELCAGTGRAIATGGGAVVDDASRRLLAESGFVVHLHADVEQQLARLRRDGRRPLLQGADRRERLRRITCERQPLYEEIADLRFDGGRRSVRQASQDLLALVRQHWQRSDRGPGP